MRPRRAAAAGGTPRQQRQAAPGHAPYNCRVNLLNADLHCHSVVSDGTLQPEALAARAKSNGVELWALTDHDEVDGQQRARAAALALGPLALLADDTQHAVQALAPALPEAVLQLAKHGRPGAAGGHISGEQIHGAIRVRLGSD